jgi:hypothetical protein
MAVALMAVALLPNPKAEVFPAEATLFGPTAVLTLPLD